MAAVAPRTILCGNERLYPAGTAVEAATTPSRWDVKSNKIASKFSPLKEIHSFLCVNFEVFCAVHFYPFNIRFRHAVTFKKKMLPLQKLFLMI